MTGGVPLEEFARVAAGGDDRMDLAEGALLIAQAEYPQLDGPAYLSQLDDLAAEARARLSKETGPYGIVNALSHFLFEEQQLRGNTEEYYDPRNSYLNDVLDRRLGIPITLALIYIEVARRVDVTAHGIGLPGHFIVRVDAGGEQLLVDPFHRGTILAESDWRYLVEQSAGLTGPLDPAFLEPVTNREFLARMLNNLKSIHLNAQDYRRALEVVERLLILHPADTGERRLRDVLRRVTSQ